MNLWSTLERAARLHPRNVAVVEDGRSTDYARLRARCAAFARVLRAHGVRPGERVSILAWNGQAFLEAYYAAAGAGAVLNPLNVRLVARELREILADCGARLLIADSGFAELLREVVAAPTAVEHVLWIGAEGSTGAPERGASLERSIAAELERGAGAWTPDTVAGDALAHLYYTSGTTGRAKGVMLTHRNVSVHALATLFELGLGERDTWAHVAPMFHLADAWATFAITWAGGRHVVLPRFEPVAALELMERERVTITNLIPTMLNLMVRHPSARGRDYRSLRLVLSGGAPIAPQVVREILDVFGCDYVQTYGMTETSPYLTLSLLKDHLRALPAEEQLAYKCKTGRPFAAVELQVVDAEGREIPGDERTVGEIRVRGETVTPGYWNRPEETAAAFRDGWLMTGDLAVIDGEGYVTIVDRKKDMILTGGENVYSTEVEHVLYEHPAILEAAVFARPDALWGERVCAAVVLRLGTNANAEELAAFCRARLAGYKVPREIDFLASLPRTGSGKILKRALREPVAG
ncbi:MAG: long-chain-fatty-acid--CoA ligase [Planctomycetes bacterium]|nr:long-chain-fatty-acid--CoA ligase [Planctomycetota bacterium]